jgi:signal transduction histidine kinase
MKLAQAKSTFVSNVSHELKTPLALIRLFAETLELGRVKNAEKAREYYRIINQESRRLTRLINNILDFARIEEGRKEYRFAATDVAEVVEEVLKSYEYQIARAGFDLRTEIAPELPSVMLDRDAISQAALNLLNNAVKYSTEVKRITVRVTAREDGVAIEVADCGVGIPPAEQEKIFEKFYRVGAGLTHDTKGSGLGLALVKHIVEAHRGRITVESAPGKGSKFTILLPAAAPDTTSSDLSYGNGEYQVATHPHH